MTTHDLDERRREELAGVLAAVRATGEKIVPEHGCGGDLNACVTECPVPYVLPMPPDEVADALAPLVAGWLAEAEAGALREAANDWQAGAGFTLMLAQAAGIPAIDYAQRALDWLRDRADRIGGGGGA